MDRSGRKVRADSRHSSPPPRSGRFLTPLPHHRSFDTPRTLARSSRIATSVAGRDRQRSTTRRDQGSPDSLRFSSPASMSSAGDSFVENRPIVAASRRSARSSDRTASPHLHQLPQPREHLRSRRIRLNSCRSVGRCRRGIAASRLSSDRTSFRSIRADSERNRRRAAIGETAVDTDRRCRRTA